MRRLILWNLITLDGFFDSEKPWDLDWHLLAWCEELEQRSIEHCKGAGAVLFGRATYEGMAAYWPGATGEIADLMNSLPKIVFSRTLGRADWANTTLVREHAAEHVARLKRERGDDLYVFGSANLSESLFRAGLFDEIRLAVAPVVLGAGRPLFGRGLPRRAMRLLEASPASSGCVVLRYAPA
ncbi:MAG: dihydrofolate reductase [Phycisphaeraceae bacterium]|nr:dihydrofolate reductase [Phycisphaeraceae bacterium]